ncbi:hypothetical protein FEP54_06018 [Burkholderia multivorans]|nr:hypothetical protein [Burkholderia multivorans]
MFDEERGRFFRKRVVGEQIAAQVDQLARDDERLRRRQPKRIAIAERERGEREIVLRAVEVEHLAAIAAIPQCEHRTRCGRHLPAIVDHAHRRIRERNPVDRIALRQPADRGELLKRRQLPPAVRNARQVDRREQLAARITLDLGRVRGEHVVRRRRRAMHACPQRFVGIDERHFDARPELRFECGDRVAIGVARPREHAQHVAVRSFGGERDDRRAQQAERQLDEHATRRAAFRRTHADSADQWIPA